MIASMTGFGRAESHESGLEILVEIRSLNHRFLDVEIRAPKNIQAFEQEIKELIRSRLSRGRVNATINVKGQNQSTMGLTIDKPLAATYTSLLKELQNEFGLEGSIRLDQLLNFPDIITVETSTENEAEVWDPIKKVMELALDDLQCMRIREGAEIEKDLVVRVTEINKRIQEIDRRAAQKSKEDFDRLKNRVKEIATVEAIDANRLEMEVALLADKMDVTEECIRFKSHNTIFLELLENGHSEGRKLNFLLQEMHREANTIGAKANDAQISHWVVEIKEEVEKLREQIQNIE
ncbi:YicC family protein [bacterium]|nr:YicC family protein [bacterium]